MKKRSESTIAAKTQPKQRRIEYNVRIGNHLYQRITRHILLLKHIKSSESKQKWIQEAIKEKLAADKNSQEEDNDRFLHLKLDSDLWQDLEEKVEVLKSNRTSASKKVFIEEAIYEKLDREEHKSKALLKDILNLSEVKSN